MNAAATELTAGLVVVGAGPAGMAAAMETAACGLDVVLLDERFPPRQGLTGVRTLFGHQVWSVSTGFRVHAIGPGGAITIVTERVVAATGGAERIIPFPGWTLPGVTGLTKGVIPGQRAVVAGCGALLATMTVSLAAAGVEVVAIVDLALTPHQAVIYAAGTGRLERVLVAPVDANGAPLGEGRWFTADTLYVGHGLIPGSDIPRLLRVPHRFDAAGGGWVPVLDADGRTALPGLYAAGGMDGAVAALSGRLAGLAAAADAGRPAPDASALRDAHSETLRAAVPMELLPGLIDAIPAETVICPCEGVTRSGIEAAIAQGAGDVNQLKHFTRCGMGACQGRVCAETAAELMARHAGSREAAGRWTMRPPLRPVPLDALLGSFDYGDIPVPQPAPL